jgi:hypothetical protein
LLLKTTTRSVKVDADVQFHASWFESLDGRKWSAMADFTHHTDGSQLGGPQSRSDQSDPPPWNTAPFKLTH